jgi:hypothetical protein
VKRLLLVLAFVPLASCAEATLPQASGPGSSVSGLLQGDGMVLDDGGRPRWCLGAVDDSLPPGCDGIPLIGWDWRSVDGEASQGGTTWGEFHVVGTYDGSSFAVTSAGPRAEPVPDTEDPFATPCATPDGGWPEPGPDADQDRIAAMHAAEAESTYAAFWISYLEPPADDGETGAYVLNAAFTDEPANHEAALRAIWQGPLCIVTFTHPFDELRRAQQELGGSDGADLGVEVTWSDIDMMQNHVELGVVVLTDEARSAIEETYGDAVEVVPALTPVA